MTAVVGALDEAAPADMSALCKQVGMTLVKSVGGASGPLYGTFFLRMATALGTADTVDAPDFAKALRAGVEGVVQRGRAEAGDKTMFDALAPALDALDAALASGAGLAAALRDATGAAEKGRDATRIDGGAQGPGQLPRAAQRRSPGPGRDVGGDADRARRQRHSTRRAGDVVTATVGLVVVSHSRALARAAVALAQEMLHGKQIRIAVAAGPGRKHVRHRRRADRRRHHRRRPGRRRRGADGPRQRGAVGRARAGTARRRRPRPGGAVPRSARGGTGGRRGRGGRWRRHRRGRRRSGRRTGRQDRPSRAGTAGGRCGRRCRRRRRVDRQLRRRQPARTARPARRAAGR